jgi:SsrA-binding protein
VLLRADGSPKLRHRASSDAAGLPSRSDGQASATTDRRRRDQSIARNKRARYDYHILETSRPGWSSGTEVKSLRDGSANISDAYGIVQGRRSLFCSTSTFRRTSAAVTRITSPRGRVSCCSTEGNPSFDRAVERQGLTLIPLELYFKNGVAKVALALGKGKESFTTSAIPNVRGRRARNGAGGAQSMMFALGLALQVAAGSAAQTLVVRDARQSLRVPTISTENGPMLRPEALRPLIAIDVKRDSMFWYTLNVWNVRLGLEIGVPVVRVGGEARPLAAAPIMKDGHLLIPLQLLSEVFPSVVPNTRWDADSSQLVLFTTSIPGASPRSSETHGRQRRRATRAAGAGPTESTSRGTARPLDGDRRRWTWRRRQWDDRSDWRRAEDL